MILSISIATKYRNDGIITKVISPESLKSTYFFTFSDLSNSMTDTLIR